MNGLMSRYKESLQKTPEHIPLSKCEQIKMDLMTDRSIHLTERKSGLTVPDRALCRFGK